MRIHRITLLIFFTLIAQFIFAQSGDFKFDGYGEILYQNYNYGPNQTATTTGSAADNRSIIDIPRFNIGGSYHFTDDIYLRAEAEFEHLGTGSAMELEYEEFGEYEFESEAGGEVMLEQFNVTKKFSKALALRVGRFVVPVSLLNSRHRPTRYFSTVRYESITQIIPTTWAENGIEIFGSYSGFSYRAQLVNGLESTGFSSEKWVTEGHQKKFELTAASNMAYVFRLDYSGFDNLMFGGSFYRGNTSENRAKPQDMEGIDGHVTIWDLHAQYDDKDFIVRADYLEGHLENSDIISVKNSRLSTNIQSPRTPVAEKAVAYYVEAGYNILPFFNSTTEQKLFPFAKYEYYNSMEKVTGNVFADPRFKRNIIAFGVNYFILPNLVCKTDYTIRKVGGFDSIYRDENTFALAVGFNF